MLLITIRSDISSVLTIETKSLSVAGLDVYLLVRKVLGYPKNDLLQLMIDNNLLGEKTCIRLVFLIINMSIYFSERILRSYHYRCVNAKQSCRWMDQGNVSKKQTIINGK
jgi:hypothetical protein